MNDTGKLNTVAQNTSKAAAAVHPEAEQAVQAMGAEGNKVVASANGKAYYVRPLGIGKVSEVTAKIQKLEQLIQVGIKSGKSENELIMESNSPILDIMCEIIQLGLIRQHPDITIDEIKDAFSLGDFPKVYQQVLDLNDFLSGMRKVLQNQ